MDCAAPYPMLAQGHGGVGSSLNAHFLAKRPLNSYTAIVSLL